LVAEVDGMAPGHALDLGCGEGRNAIWLASQGWDVIGVDFSRVGLDKAHRLAAQRHLAVEWVLADVTTHRPARAAFDLVAIPLPAAARGVARGGAWPGGQRAGPGGTLLVIGHDITNPTHGYGGPQDPEVLYSPDQIASGLGGLVIDKAERVHRPVETDGGPS
jgi:SAM-dependent methyltransferase